MKWLKLIFIHLVNHNKHQNKEIRVRAITHIHSVRATVPSRLHQNVNIHNLAIGRDYNIHTGRSRRLGYRYRLRHHDIANIGNIIANSRACRIANRTGLNRTTESRRTHFHLPRCTQLAYQSACCLFKSGRLWLRKNYLLFRELFFFALFLRSFPTFKAKRA